MTKHEVRWLTDREDRAWRGYLRMRRLLEAQLGRDLQQASGLSVADYEVLVNLSEAPRGRLRINDLAAEMEWEKSRLSHHLTRMEGRGLVRKDECATDGRGAFVVLTPKGRAAIRKAAPLHVERVRHYVFDVLTPQQLDTLAEIADDVVGRLEASE